MLASGLRCVILRPTFFYQSLELLAGPVRRGFLPAATGAGAIAFVDRNDVAAAAVRALLDPALDGSIHNLTGPRSWTMAEIVAAIGQAVPQRLRHISPPRMLMAPLLRLGSGMDRWTAQQLSALMACCADGGEDLVTDAVLQLTGRPPVDFSHYLQQSSALFSR